jgi:hypothetical protein
MVAAAGLLPIKAVNWWSAQVKSGCEVGENHHCHDLFRCRYPCMFNKWTEREAIWIFFFFWNEHLSECYLHLPEYYLNENLSECYLHLPECAPIHECYLSECFLKWKGVCNRYEFLRCEICPFLCEFVHGAMLNLFTIPNGYIAHMTHLIITHAKIKCYRLPMTVHWETQLSCYR